MMVASSHGCLQSNVGVNAVGGQASTVGVVSASQHRRSVVGRQVDADEMVGSRVVIIFPADVDESVVDKTAGCSTRWDPQSLVVSQSQCRRKCG